MDAWIANLNNGEQIVEHWIPNELSPWLRLMNYCKDKNLYLTNLRLTICSKTVALHPRSVAYWQIHQQSCLPGVGDIPISRGIGFVEGSVVKIIWGVRTPVNQPYFWSEQRDIGGQNNIIWSPKANFTNVK